VSRRDLALFPLLAAPLADGSLELRRIFLEGFELSVSIGIHDFELASPQRVVVNVELFLEPPTATGHEDIRQTVDYDFVRRGVAAFVAGRHIRLQETLVEEIARLCLAPAGVAGVRVSTEKPDVYPDCRAVGYEIVRLKPRSGGPA